ncbi:hypothetical protein GCM10010282_56890 [Streptomyces roseolus]|nr:hypothetical protein GCM10010282_56890 [Streptomyces roseolus]
MGADRLAPFDPGQLDLADPYPVYRRYRERDPVHAVPSPDGGAGGAGDTTWYLFRYAEVARVLAGRAYRRRSPATGRAAAIPEGYETLRRVVENWLVFLDPPDHTRLRARVNPPLASAAVAGLRPAVREIAEELAAPLAGRPAVDVVRGFAAPFPRSSSPGCSGWRDGCGRGSGNGRSRSRRRAARAATGRGRASRAPSAPRASWSGTSRPRWRPGGTRAARRAT